MIKFHEIRYKNFLSNGNIFTHFRLDKAKTTLVVGENGAGKSTMLDAICFALYNKAYRNINKPQLVNSINKKDCLVEVDFTIGSNEYMVRRGIKPAIFEIYQNGIMLPQDADSGDSQTYLETFILRMSYKSFCQICILGTATFKPFMKLTKGERREVIEDILDLQVFTTMNEVLKEHISANKESTQNVETEIKIINEKIKMQNNYLEALQKNTDDLIEEVTSRMANLKQNIQDLNEKVFENASIRDKLLTEVGDARQLSNRLNKIKELNMKLSEKLNALKKSTDFYHDNDTCPTCKQGIDHDFKTNILSEKAEEIAKTEIGLSKITEELATTQDQLTKTNEILSSCTQINIENSSMMATIQSYERMLGEAAVELDKLNDRKQTIVADASFDVALPERLADKETEKNQLLKEKDIQGIVATFLKDSGAKSRIIKKYVPVINKHINRYLAALDFSVTFELDSQFEETIKSRHRDEFSYESFSEGEKSRINLAILFTWREVAKLRNSAATNLLICDEIFDGSLDSGGTEEFMKILKASFPGTHFVIISHKVDVMLDKFDRTIRFRKTKNYSEMEEI